MQQLLNAVVWGSVGQAQQDSLGGIPYWVILVVALLVILVGIIWFLVNEEKEKKAEAGESSPGTASPVAPTAAATPTAPPPAQVVGTEGEDIVPEDVQPDDLKLIEGIGPKLSSVLQQAGITTWAKLAQTEVSELQRILDEAGISKISDPATWPEQAALAAAGDWDGLEKLQDELKGGRRAG